MYNKYGTGNPALHALATSLDEAEELKDRVAELEAELEKANNKITCLEDDMLDMYDQDFVDDIQEQSSEYEQAAIYWENENDSALESISDLNEQIKELEAELEAYRTIEDKTGKTPEQIIEMFSTLQGTADFIKESVSSGN